jgi:branched-chain amino acid transport system permease protein
MVLQVLNVFVQGVLLGGLYALFALGLSLSTGIVKLVNIAHGDLIILMSFVLFALTQLLGIPLLVAFLIALPLAFSVGYLLQKGLLQRVMGKGLLPPLLVTFGLSVIVQNGLLELFGADTRSIPTGSLQTTAIEITDTFFIGLLPLLTLLVAVVLIFLLDRLIYRSRFGARLRAIADSPETARLIGLPVNRTYAIALGMVGVTVCIAALFLGMRMNFEPLSGPSRLIIAFEVIVLGGLGNLWGILAGGVVLGLAQSIGAEFDIRMQLLAGHLVFLVVLLVRPQGIFTQR